MAMPSITIEWKLPIWQVVPLLVYLLTGAGAYYNLRSDVNELQKFAIKQEVVDSKQDAVQDKVVTDLKNVMKENKEELKYELRELGRDLRSSNKK